MSNEIITSTRFAKFNEAMMKFFGEHPVLFHTDERRTLLQEEARYFSIVLIGKLVFPMGYTSKDCIDLVKKLRQSILAVEGGNIRPNNDDWVYRIIQPGEMQSPYLDILIAYSESNLSDRQIEIAKLGKLA